jgi:2-polyprenyl-3-methyl-5-hydroxy-6-metoxy-1,4-benzoquinol methylase
MTQGDPADDGVVAGNLYDKYRSTNPIVRRLMQGFDRGLDELLAGAGPVRSVLEAGCGEGHLTAKLAARFPGARVLGMDRSRAIVEVARRAHPELPFSVGSIYDPMSPGAWDLVVASEVLEHLDDPARALAALCAGQPRHVLVTVPREPLWRILNVARGRYWSRLGDTPGHVQHWSLGSLLRFLGTRLEIEGVRAPLPWIQVLGRPCPADVP